MQTLDPSLANPSLPDRRLNAYRLDLADARLVSIVEAQRYVEGVPARLNVPVAPLRGQPDIARGTDTEVLLGEGVRVLDTIDGWSWVVCDLDGYVGYLPDYCLSPDSPEPTHIVTAPRTYVYSGHDLKLPFVYPLSMGSRIAVIDRRQTRGMDYLLLEGGSAVIAGHCRAIDEPADTDCVAIAARLIETPYLWGGRSAFGIDCSGLVQLSMMMAGRSVLRDSDMQAAGLGAPIERGDLARGDLVFWKGHVAIMEDAETMIHANGMTMTVAREGLSEAIARIAPLYGAPTGYRRP